MLHLVKGHLIKSDRKQRIWVINKIMCRKIVNLPYKKRSIFDTSEYIDNYLPRVYKDPKAPKKERQKAWEEGPEWPPAVVRPLPDLSDRALIHSLEKEQINKINLDRGWNVPSIYSGDVIEITKFYSLSGGTFYTIQGMCMGVKKRNSLNHSFTLLIPESSESRIVAEYKAYSPLMARIKVKKLGSGKKRNKLNYLRDIKWNPTRFLTPLVGGRGATRKADKRHSTKKERKIRRLGLLDQVTVQEKTPQSIKSSKTRVEIKLVQDDKFLDDLVKI